MRRPTLSPETVERAKELLEPHSGPIRYNLVVETAFGRQVVAAETAERLRDELVVSHELLRTILEELGEG